MIYILLASFIALHTFSGVAGISIDFILKGESAFTKALMTAPVAPVVPASPAPLTPRELVLDCQHLLKLSNLQFPNHMSLQTTVIFIQNKEMMIN